MPPSRIGFTLPHKATRIQLILEKIAHAQHLSLSAGMCAFTLASSLVTVLASPKVKAVWKVSESYS